MNTWTDEISGTHYYYSHSRMPFFSLFPSLWFSLFYLFPFSFEFCSLFRWNTFTHTATLTQHWLIEEQRLPVYGRKTARESKTQRRNEGKNHSKWLNETIYVLQICIWTYTTPMKSNWTEPSIYILLFACIRSILAFQSFDPGGTTTTHTHKHTNENPIKRPRTIRKNSTFMKCAHEARIQSYAS